MLAGASALGAGLAAGVPFAATRAAAEAKMQGKPLLYFSDYFSFVGRDKDGWVYFAIDNNRGRDGDAFQADHFIVMYDERTGWVELTGSQHYDNTEKLLERIPDSAYFSFRGSLETGTIMQSAVNGMRMTVAPLPRTLYRENADGIFWLGGAPATLDWIGRRLEGRVIVEYLQRHNWNRFTADFTANWRNFNGLYLLTDTGADFYMHSHERQGGSDLNGRLVGFASWATPAPVTELDFKVTRSEPADGGKYKWPTAWQVDFAHAGRAYRLVLERREQAHIAHWDTGGFAMTVAAGTIAARDGSERHGVVGWAELLI
jgi:hypothetical protein